MQDQVSLSDKYVLDEGRAFMSGVQALVRLPIMIARRDRRAGLNTAGFISGYRGSPLGNYDQQLLQAKAVLDPLHIVVKPAINEDLGATAVWGTQHVPLFEGARFDGVFGIWYGKGPGVDRSGDVLKHANMAGTTALGGVLAVVGDDHACKSSTLPNQSELAFIDAEIPVLSPSTIAEVLEYGLKGIALSRFYGGWVALKTLSDLMDASAAVDLSDRFDTRAPVIDLPADGLHIRATDTPAEKEARHRHYRLPAASAFGRLNGFDKVVWDTPNCRIGIATAGKAFTQVMEALDLLDIDADEARDIGLSVWKVGMVWPLDAQGARAFAGGLEKLLVVEERREVIEPQLRSALYSLPDGRRPLILGKRGLSGEPLISDVLELDTLQVALALYDLLPEAARHPARRERAEGFRARLTTKETLKPDHVRAPFFCAGCPHNTSTVVPEGSRGLAGIGCHYMATFMPRRTDICTHMGGEGVTWMGQAPFTDEAHVFTNLGDGTYFHSGLLAIRQAIAAGVNITYKILYNDVVAMTGGQSVDGQLTPVMVAQQVRAEGVERIALVSDDPEKWEGEMPSGTTYAHRDDLEAVQTELRTHKGVSVLIYDQACATELRRRRKRGLAPKPAARIFINPAVCEGCGDCQAKSNCVAINPLETELGRKREIDQSACNIDTSCVKGFCPSFVAVEGAALKKAAAPDISPLIADLPDITPPLATTRPVNILLAGIGGLGVTSLSAMLGMAAHIDGCEVSVADQTGLAQRGGGVDAHVRIVAQGVRLPAPRISAGEADVLLAADMVQATGKTALPLVSPDRTLSFVNSALTSTAAFTLNRDIVFDRGGLMGRLRKASKRIEPLDAGGVARRLLGDAVYGHMILLGAAWQAGAVPLSRFAIEEAIDLNGAEKTNNHKAFALGRALYLGRIAPPKAETAFDVEAFVARRIADLSAYQNAAYAAQYETLIDAVRKLESPALLEAVARNAFKLMAYKDEYEVARLYADSAFRERLAAQFDDPKKLSVFLAPPLLARKNPRTGEPRKMKFGGWVFGAFGVLKGLKGLRGTVFDPFGHTHERRLERRLRDDYLRLVRDLIAQVQPHNLTQAVAIARLPENIRGFGHIKAASVETYEAQKTSLLAAFAKVKPAQKSQSQKEPLYV
ncbi:indolepyruvate ferredoxin oxidoreductase family protein [Asticcacaulis sp. AND118]|uniref:indolepyruvate ferredoxin oxidoreductase family protein n=1 Tax=Asticcacaulis sp. AND118 TaxID=2840468 RepID=UPI001CFF7FA7|nr:indolepyruvate ferredoxin oxidoreductase family protein [Asticcacaulis sp. AND118]UDF03255.1 indolepyruvate ferredoxin oxidoreductase family protein [Asticcacaulis sp. AND118]